MALKKYADWRSLPAEMLRLLVRLTRDQRRLLAAAMDGVLCVLAVWIAYSLRLGTWDLFSRPVITFAAVALILWYPIAWSTGVYRSLIRFSGARTIAGLAAACSALMVPLIIAFVFYRLPAVPRTLTILHPIIFLMLLASSRIIIRFALLDMLNLIATDARRVLVYGAGRAGQQLALSLRHERQVYLVGFIDDDIRLDGQRLDGIPVFGSHRLSKLLENPMSTRCCSRFPARRECADAKLSRRFRKKDIYVRSLPSLTHIIEGSITVNDLREIQIEELLGREAVAPNEVLLSKTIVGKTVLVSGAGGSIGSELCRQILQCRPARLILLEQSEFALYAIEQELSDIILALGTNVPLILELGNVADRSTMMRIYGRHRPDTVFHAAAYKHVPLVESNPVAGMRNNVMGTLYSVEAAEANGVANFTLISTDKAVRPTNVMGASKRVCELILQARAQQARTATVFSMVRFGNVLGSSGSVVPRFKVQIASGGPITITHRDITRYFMTIPEASQLVIQATAMARGGEVFVLDMGQPVKIVDLARSMVRLSGLSVRDAEHPDGDIEITETGLRPGEKLYEELLIGDNPESTKHPRILRAREGCWPWDTLEREMIALDTALDIGNADIVMEILRRLVPEYAPDAAWTQQIAGDKAGA